jgi:hypothetical protein
MVSADGSDRASPKPIAVHKTPIARIARMAHRRSCTALSPVAVSIARKRSGACQVISFGACVATQSEKGCGVFGYEIAICECGTQVPRFVMRGAQKST